MLASKGPDCHLKTDREVLIFLLESFVRASYATYNNAAVLRWSLSICRDVLVAFFLTRTSRLDNPDGFTDLLLLDRCECWPWTFFAWDSSAFDFVDDLLPPMVALPEWSIGQQNLKVRAKKKSTAESKTTFAQATSPLIQIVECLFFLFVEYYFLLLDCCKRDDRWPSLRDRNFMVCPLWELLYRVTKKHIYSN